MFSADNLVGRLVEVRVRLLRDRADIEAFQAAFLAAVRKTEQPTVVVCADYRSVTVLSPIAADLFTEILTRNNARIERSALLCSPDHPTAALQIERTVRLSNTPNRRSFRDAESLRAWLDEILEPRERARLAAFFEGRP